ncbi:MAG: hypothetical protein SF187_10660 [Deltaproteobacteria bacterium]|nr:hypothetical protein [Deltaproteobacteria bacterium]
MTNRQHTPVPQYLLERLAKGELPQAQAEELRQRLEQQPGGLAAAMENLAKSDDEIFSRHPPHWMANEIRRRSGQQTNKPARRPFVLPALALGAVGALVLIAVAPRSTTTLVTDVGEETINIKGAKPHLVVYRKREGAPERLTAQDVVHPGDVLQVAYVVPPNAQGAAAPYGVIVSIDAANTTTLHLPSVPGRAPTLQTNGENRLPNAYELDNSKGFERFWLVLSPTPFESQTITTALQTGAALPADTTSFQVTFKKDPQ